MTDKTHIKNMLDAMINGNKEQSEVEFHTYFTSKMKDSLNGTEEAVVEVDPKAASEETE